MIYTAFCILYYRDCARELFWVSLVFHHIDVFSYGHNLWEGTKPYLPAGQPPSLMEALCEHCAACLREVFWCCGSLVGLCSCLQGRTGCGIVPRFLTSLHVQCDGLLLWCFSVAYAVVILSVIGMQSEVEELSAKSHYVQHFFSFLWNAVHSSLCSITWNL